MHPTAQASPINLLGRPKRCRICSVIDVLKIDPVKRKVRMLTVGDGRHIVAIGRRGHDQIKGLATPARRQIARIADPDVGISGVLSSLHRLTSPQLIAKFRETARINLSDLSENLDW